MAEARPTGKNIDNKIRQIYTFEVMTELMRNYFSVVFCCVEQRHHNFINSPLLWICFLFLKLRIKSLFVDNKAFMPAG